MSIIYIIMIIHHPIRKLSTTKSQTTNHGKEQQLNAMKREKINEAIERLTKSAKVHDPATPRYRVKN